MRFAATLIALLSASHGWGATYYVSTEGRDSNPGTEKAPFRHLSRAAQAARRPGDTVIVADGIYDNEGVVAPKYVVTLRNSGARGRPITFKAGNRGRVILDAMNTWKTTRCDGASAYFDLKDASFIVIEGFVIQRGCDEGIHSNDGAHDIVIRWNEIRNIANRLVTDQIGRCGIFLNRTQYNFTFDGNVFHDIGRTHGQDNLHFDHGIYTHASNLTIVNNVFYNINRGWSIQLADGARDYLISNNTFAFGNADGKAGQIMFWGNNAGIAIRNNIFYKPNGSALNQYEATISRGAFDHNLIYGARSISPGRLHGIAAGANLMNTDPMFVNASQPPYDFRLRPASPATGAGIPLPEVQPRIQAGVRGARPADIGAYVGETVLEDGRKGP